MPTKSKQDLQKNISSLEDQVSSLNQDIAKITEQINNTPDFSNNPKAIKTLEAAHISLGSKQSVLSQLTKQLEVTRAEVEQIADQERQAQIKELLKVEHILMLSTLNALEDAHAEYSKLVAIQADIWALRGHPAHNLQVKTIMESVFATLKNLKGFHPEWFGGEARAIMRSKEYQARLAEHESKRLALAQERQDAIDKKHNEALAKARGIAAWQDRTKKQSKGQS